MPRKLKRYLIIGLTCVVALVVAVVTSRITSLPQASYGLFDQWPSFSPTDRILVLSPHQDDETIGAAGLILQAKRAGATVKVVWATDGNRRGLKAIRHQEAVAATTVLGLTDNDRAFLDLPDGQLSRQANFSPLLNQQIDDFHPTLLVTTLPEDIHPDHAACGRAVSQLSATRQIPARYFLVHYHGYPQPETYRPHDHLLPPLKLVNVNLDWLVLPLTEADRATKQQAIDQYRSQLELKNPILRELLVSLIRDNELFAQPRDASPN